MCQTRWKWIGAAHISRCKDEDVRDVTRCLQDHILPQAPAQKVTTIPATLLLLVMKGTDKVLTAIYSVGGQPTRWVFFFLFCFFLSTTAIPVLMRPFIKVSWSKVYTFYIFMEFIPRKWFVCVSGSSRVPPSTTSDSCHADTSFCSCRSFLHLSSPFYQTEIINLSVAVFPQMTVAAMERMFDMLTGDYLACTPPTCKLFSFLTFPLL